MNFTENKNDRAQNMSRIAMVGMLHVLLFALIANTVQKGHTPIHILPPYHPHYVPPEPPAHKDPLEKPPPLPLASVFVQPPVIPVDISWEVTPVISDVTHVPPSTDGTNKEGSGSTDGKGADVIKHAIANMVSGSCEKPEYPANSLRDEEAGTVTLAMLIDTDGHVLESKVDKSSGYKSLDKAARDALSLCRFKPASSNGVAEKSWTKIQYAWAFDH